MRVLVTGATGFVGRALVPLLQREGHRVTVWARSAARAQARLGGDVEISGPAGARSLEAVVEACDAIVNLAGEPIVGGRWTAARRRALRESRVTFTTALVHAIERTRRRPSVLVSASAVGYYGDRGAEVLNEASLPASDFLGQLCQDWERAALDAESLGLRVVALRMGVVLGRDGGALARMLPPFRLGVGGPLGSGRQYAPWIHLHDLVRVVARAIADERFRGPINVVAPQAVTNRELSRALGAALRRPAVCSVPAVALRALFGEAATVLLSSQRIEPRALHELGYAYRFASVDSALDHIVNGPPVEVGPLASAVDARGSELGQRYLEKNPPAAELRATTTISAPLDETFAFFSKAENLGMLTPSAMDFAIAGSPAVIGENAVIEYRLRVGPVPIGWRSRIVSWRPGEGFVDLQEAGPYRSWWHEHAFRADGAVTVMEDRVCYTPPLGVLGRLANRLFIQPTLKRIFRYRADVIQLRFGTADPR